MKKPKFLQIFIASGCPLQVVMLTPFLFPIYVAWLNLLPFHPLEFVWNVLIAFLLGLFVAILFMTVTIRLLAWWWARANGGPLKIGDSVQILSGPHEGRILRICSAGQWTQMGARLPGADKNDSCEYYYPFQLIRIARAE